MSAPANPNPEKESVVFYDLSPQLEAELLRRAKANGTDPAAEAAKNLEGHTAKDAADSKDME